MAITRLSGGLTPADGADPRTFPTIFNVAADSIDALDAKNVPQFGTAVPSNRQVLAYSTAISGYAPADVFGAAVNGTAVYQYVTTLYYTSAGTATFTKDSYPWLRAIRVRAQGGGGGGGGAATTGAGNSAIGSSGGGGGYSESFITDIAGLATSVNVVTGAGGNGATAGNNAGSAGANSSFGSLVIALGGPGGSGSAAVTPAATTGFTTGGVSGANAGTGQFVIGGNASQAPPAFLASSNVFPPPRPAGILGATGANAATSTGRAGNAGVLYGGGGEGGCNAASQATARAGGNGAAGIVIVELYA